MSTNYYGKIIPTKNDYLVLRYKLLTGPVELAIKYCDQLDTQIHIGKQSSGWKFLFNLNGNKYYNDLESLKSFLLTLDLYDEYNHPISVEEFWKAVNLTQNNKSHLLEYPAQKSIIDGYEFFDCEFS